MPKNLKTNLINENTINVLKKFMVFENLSLKEIKTLLSLPTDDVNACYHDNIMKLCYYKKNETVINEGDFDSWSYWVVKGTFDVIQDGNPIITFSKPGEIFGEMSVFEGIPRTASVVAAKEGICLGIDMSVLDTVEDDKIRSTMKKSFYSVILNRIGATKKKMMLEKQKLEEKYEDLIDFEEKIKRKAGIEE
ncbi:MAG: cyclic nucleotide-binding domain-containing protein [Desulfobacteraceae bacterium]|nr:cyclic nucleotide-binding domain-containing protein [Desulfobacteraceae bacterium]